MPKTNNEMSAALMRIKVSVDYDPLASIPRIRIHRN